MPLHWKFDLHYVRWHVLVRGWIKGLTSRWYMVSLGDTLFWGWEFWWLGFFFMVLAIRWHLIFRLGILMILFHGVGPPLQGCVPLSSPTAPSLDIMPSQDIMPSHSFVKDFVSVPVLDNMRWEHSFVNELPFHCSSLAHCSWIGPCPELLHWTLAGNCLQLFWVEGLCYVEAPVWNCFALCVCIRRCERGGAITEGGLDTPCLANTTPSPPLQLQLSKPVWPNILEQWQI